MERLQREILDKLFLAAAQDPRSVRATLKIEKVGGEPLGTELETLVTGHVMTLLHDLMQAIQDQP